MNVINKILAIATILLTLSVVVFIGYTIGTDMEKRDKSRVEIHTQHDDCTIQIPNDAHYGGCMWQENRLVITFTEG